VSVAGGCSSYVLDADDRITQVSGPLEATLGHALGHSIWETSPEAERLFKPYFEQARRTGEEVEFTEFYRGFLARRRVVPAGRSLTVYVTPMRELDVTTLGTLAASLGQIEAELAARAPARRDRPAPASLRALP